MLKEELRRRNIPDVLRFEDGNRVATEADWSRRKKEILYSLQQNEYGIAPGEVNRTPSRGQ